MRTLHVVAAILLTGSVYCGAPSIISHIEGDSFIAGVVTFADEVEKCYLKTPSQEFVEFKPEDTSSYRYELLPDDPVIKCRVRIQHLTQNDEGIWTIYSKSTTGVEFSQSYNLTVHQLVTTETPTTTVEIETLTPQNINTTFGNNITITITDFAFVTTERCLIVTPSGDRIDMNDLNKPNVEAITNPNAACAVRISINSEEDAGQWLLISEGARFSTAIERRLPFSIHIEENVDASVDEVTLADGNDFYIRLKNSIPNPDTCRLVGPNGSRDFEIDQRYLDTCGYLIRKVTAADSGIWEIQYGDRMLYRARVVLHVNGESASELEPLTWSRGNPLNTTFGPEYAVYCKLESPRGRVVYDGFGRCRAIIDRVTTEHDGVWKMTVGRPGGVLTESYKVVVHVVERAHDTPATTSVSYNKPTVIITCKASSQFPFKACKFRNPQGEVLLASEGVGQGRYTFHGNGTSFTDGLYTHECGFQITDPLLREHGLWRCSLESEDAHHYGFLKLLSPWNMRDPEVVAGIIRKPTLSPFSDVTSMAGSSSVFRCSCPAALRYCYFRARNGTVYNVDQTSANYEGSGFPSGECGIRFDSLSVGDSGPWSCHVGIEDGSEELRSTFNVIIQEPIVVSQSLDRNTLVLEAQVHDYQQLEYCRFIRIDGLGFTSVTLPRYTDTSDLSSGRCGLAIADANLLERHPWTVAARVRGADEVIATSTHTIDIPRPIGRRFMNFPLIIILSVGLTFILLGAVVGPRRNRQWAAERAGNFRNSFRNSFRKTPLQQTNTASAA